jgi:anti-sigma28 factor (negative regulator of flagellin synthesis)
MWITDLDAFTLVIQVVSQEEVEQQQQAFHSLIKQLGQASSAEIEAVLATREKTEPEADLSTDVVARLKEQIQAGMNQLD